MTEVWEKTVAAQRRVEAAFEGTQRDQWEGSQVAAAQLLASVQGLDDDDAREVVVDQIAAKYHTDPEDGSPIGISAKDASLLKALMQPTTAASVRTGSSPRVRGTDPATHKPPP